LSPKASLYQTEDAEMAAMTKRSKEELLVMPFGRYQGVPISALEDEYLFWLNRIEIHDPLLAQPSDRRSRPED